MANNDAKKQVLEMAVAPTSSQVDDEFSILSKKLEVHEFDGKCAQCKDIIKSGHAVICAEDECKVVLHPGCFGTHMITVHAVESLPIIIRRDYENSVSSYIIKGEIQETKSVPLGRDSTYVIGNESKTISPSIEVKVGNDQSLGKKPIPKKQKTQREQRKARTKDRLADKPVHKNKEQKPDVQEPNTTDDTV